MPMKPREMVKLLTDNGFVFQRQKGSHAIYFNPATSITTVVPMHAKELNKGIEQRILKESGIK